MTVGDQELNDHCNRLMDASLQLLSTVKAMEAQLSKQKQRPPSQQEQQQSQQQQQQQQKQLPPTQHRQSPDSSAL